MHTFTGTNSFIKKQHSDDGCVLILTCFIDNSFAIYNDQHSLLTLMQNIRTLTMYASLYDK
jgi:hypothetical protein